MFRGTTGKATNFLKTFKTIFFFLFLLQSVQVSSSGSSEFSNELINLATGTEPLPILYEDKELVSVPCYQMAHTPGKYTNQKSEIAEMTE